MDITPSTVYVCPSCNKPSAKMNVSGQHAQNAASYSDGVKTGSSGSFVSHYTPNFGKCPFCKNVFFLDNLEKTGEYAPHKEYEYITDPVLNDFINIAEKKLFKTPEEEIEVRKCIWRALNDKVRYSRKQNERDNDEENKFFQSEEARLWRENCQSLLSLLEQKYEEQKTSGDDAVNLTQILTTIAELHRNLGHFDTCFDIIESLPDSFEWLKYKYMRRTASHDHLVFMLMAPDEKIENFEIDDADLSDPGQTIEYFTKKIDAKDTLNFLYHLLRAKAYFLKGEYQSALNDANIALSNSCDSEGEYYFISQIYEKLDDTDKAKWNYFKGKHIEAYNKIFKDEWISEREEIRGGSEKPLISTERLYIEKSADKLFLCLPVQEGGPLEPEILYSGGENALFRRKPDQFILLENVPEDFFTDDDVRKAIFNKKEALIAEKNQTSNPVREYAVNIRLVFEKLDSIESIIRDGYPLFTSLRARVCANMEKPITELIAKHDCINLAAVIAREENYPLLKKYIDEGLPVNEKVSFGFKKWRPTVLYYLSINKLVGFMEDPLKALRFLAANGANANIPGDDGDTPLGNQCLENGLSIIMKTLLSIGADPNCFTEIDNGPIKPLHLMLLPSGYNEDTDEFIPIRDSDIEKIKLLIEGGANVNYISDSGSTALSLALNNSEAEVRKELVRLLIDSGADVPSAIDALNKGVENEHSKSAFTLYEIYSGRIEGLNIKQDSVLARKYLLISSDLINKLNADNNEDDDYDDGKYHGEI